MRVAFTLAALLFSLNLFAFPKTPRIWDNPGHLCSPEDRDFDRYRYKERVPYCRRNVSVKTKNAVCAAYGVYDRTNYTVDHIIPLSLGGSNHWTNLWCQHRSIFTGHIEFYYYNLVSRGEMRQVKAVHELVTWKFNPKGKDHIPKPPLFYFVDYSDGSVDLDLE